MGKFFVELTDPTDNSKWYIEWSTVVDAPRSFGMRRDAIEAYVLEEYGREGVRDLPARLARIDQHGTSAQPPLSAADAISINRAGPDETELTMEEIVAAYCRDVKPCLQCHSAYIRGFDQTCRACSRHKGVLCD